MLQIPENVREDLVKLVPLAVLNEMSCFVYYDNHPRCNKQIDVIICTNSGEVKEYFEREIVLEVNLDCPSKPSEIKILRNSLCNLFYIISAVDVVIILARTYNTLYIHHIVNNVESYEIDDSGFIGQAYLKIISKDDAVPLIFDDNIRSLGHRALMMSSLTSEETLPVITELNRKLVEAKYIVKCNENAYKEFLKLRQITTLKIYQKINPNFRDSIFENSSKDMAGAFMIKTFTPLIKMCNNKVVIILNISNRNEVVIEDVHILLHSRNRSSLVYTTKIYEKERAEPFWIETDLQCLKTIEEYAVVGVIDIKELKENVTSRIDFNTALVYKKQGNEHLLPFQNVSVSALDTMGGQFDVLCANPIDEYGLLSLLSTTEKIDLILRYIRTGDDPGLCLPDTFCTYLGMERVEIAPNIIVHRSSPYHILHSVIIFFLPNEKETDNKDVFRLAVYTRSPDQVISLIHFIHDAIPHRMVITTPNHKIISKSKELSRYNEVASGEELLKLGYLKYASAMFKQTEILLEYLDHCMIKMHESKEPEVQDKIMNEIDIFAVGIKKFLALREQMLQDEASGLRHLRNRVHSRPNSEFQDVSISIELSQ
ncbi:uncharacterized protein ACR2FA_002714 [Aphomia sociella]